MQTADEDTLNKIEEAYNVLKISDSQSLLKKHLTQEVFDTIKHRVTETGANLLDVINSGVVNLDSHIGVYAPDAESYVLFKELFDPIIEEYHINFMPEDEHPIPEYGEYELLGNLDDLGDYVISTRIRCARSLEGYPFNPKMTLEQYTELEQDVEAALDLLEGEYAGYYTTLADIPPTDAERLVEDHLLFKLEQNSLRFLEAAGATRFWPKGRGIFLNSDNTFVVWVNEEDHLRIISIQKGGDIRTTYERFVEGLMKLEDRLHFTHSQRLGFLNFCPTNLGTAIRASVHIRLPNLGKDRERLEEIAEHFHLQVRGTSGEHSEAEDFVFDISNKRRLGLTEIEAIQDMYEGAQELITIEQELENQSGNI